MKNILIKAKAKLLILISKFQKQPGIDFETVINAELQQNQKIALDLTGSYEDKRRLRIMQIALLIAALTIIYAMLGVK